MSSPLATALSRAFFEFLKEYEDIKGLHLEQKWRSYLQIYTEKRESGRVAIGVVIARFKTTKGYRISNHTSAYTDSRDEGSSEGSLVGGGQ